ncbi:MAG: homoserine O-succinyltransferase [Paracoccaceae bacterium]
MPIKLPETLPAYATLDREGVMVMGEGAAARQDIRPLRIALLNLMPLKIATETQFARLIGATPLQIELTLMRMTGHLSRNTDADHLAEFYRTAQDVMESGEKFDGLIVTGAPIEHLPFEDVTYWPELTRLFDWAATHAHMTLGVCWGGMALIRHRRGVPKRMLDAKAFGVFRHANLAPQSPYLRGFSDDCAIPVSRWTEVTRADVEAAGLRVLLDSAEVGPCLVEDGRALYLFNHLEYDSTTLAEEYRRDLARDARISAPRDYFPNGDAGASPPNRWRSHAHLLYGNWINQIYQTTKFDLHEIGT